MREYVVCVFINKDGDLILWGIKHVNPRIVKSYRLQLIKDGKKSQNEEFQKIKKSYKRWLFFLSKLIEIIFIY